MSNIELKSISKIYKMTDAPVVALKDINLSIELGEFMSLAGPSGSGKTTLLNIIGALLRPTSGHCFVDGVDVFKQNDRELASYRFKKIGFVFQNDNLIDALDVKDNILYGVIVGSRKDRGKLSSYKDRVEEIIDMVGLTKWAKHRPGELSGGQRQRISIARALIKNPSIILADEPTASLDSECAIEILNIMRKINQEKRVTFIISSHDRSVLDLTDRTVMLKDGSILD